MNEFVALRSALAPGHRLAAQATAAARGGILIVQAPPGFGKTVLLDELRTDDPSDHLLVLDSVERAGLAELMPLIDRRQREGGVVVATRDAVVASEVSLRFPGRCKLLTHRQLRHDAASIADVMGLNPGDPLVSDLFAVTSGWPMAVHLLAPDFRAAPGFHGDFGDPFACLFTYFDALEELFDPYELRQVAELLDFGELTPTLLRSVFDGDTVVNLLRTMARRGALVFEETVPYAHFRIEPLFARYLQWRFEGTEPAEGAGAKSLALARHGQVRPALRLAAASRRPDMLARVIETLGGMRVPLTIGYEASRYLQKIRIAGCSQVDVIIARSYMALQQGHVGYARQLLAKTAQAADDVDQDVARKLALMDLIVRLYENRPIPPADLIAFETQFAEGLCDDQIGRAILQQIRASSHYFLGDYPTSYACARAAMEAANGLEAPLLTNYSKFYVALTELRTGQLSRATALLESAVTMSEQQLGAGNPQAAQASLLLARIHLERLDLVAASQLMARFGEAGDLHANWRDAAEMVTITMVSLIQASDGLVAALDYLDARQAAYAHSDMPICAQMVAVVRAQLLFETGRNGEAADALDEAEALAGFQLGDSLTGYGQQAALLRYRLAGARGTDMFDDAGFAMLSHQIDKGEDAFLRLHSRFAEYDAHRRAGRTLQAQIALHRALRFASRHRLDATFLAEVRRSPVEIMAELSAIDLSSDEADTIARIRERVGAVESAPPDSKLDPGGVLSPRERQVLDYLADGLSSKEMARNLNISVGTVKGYRRKLYEKLSIYRRSDAVLAARAMHAGHPLSQARQ